MASHDASAKVIHGNNTSLPRTLGKRKSNVRLDGSQNATMQQKQNKKSKKRPLLSLQERLIIANTTSRDMVRRQVDMLQARLHYLRLICRPFTNSIADFVNHCCGITNEYVHLFSHGIVTRTKPNYNRQLAYIHTMLQPNMLFCGRRGTDFFIEQHQSYLKLFRRRSIKSGGMMIVSGEEDMVVKTNCTISLTLSRESLAALYPHVLQDEVLVQRIMGLDLQVPTQLYFYFTNSGRVFRIDGEFDFIRAWSALISDIDKIEKIIREGQLQSDGIIR